MDRSDVSGLSISPEFGVPPTRPSASGVGCTGAVHTRSSVGFLSSTHRFPKLPPVGVPGTLTAPVPGAVPVPVPVPEKRSEKHWSTRLEEGERDEEVGVVLGGVSNRKGCLR